jgi:hypothetical protein
MLVVKKHKKLLLNLKDPDRITAIMPTARTLEVKGRTLVAIPHKLDEVRVLRNLGFDPPNPMGSYYDWPGRYKPFVHQQVTGEFLTMNPRAFVLNGMGSGKTMSVLWAFDYLRKLGKVKRMLVISPLSTLERAWGDEIFRHFPDMSFAVLHGSREKRHKLLACDFDVYIINHDGIKSKETIELLRNREGLNLVVVDEVASFRNASTERFKALNLLINGDRKTGEFRKEWAWGLTGTPTPNAPTDAWAQVKLINPGKAPGFFGQFRDSVMRPSGPYKWVMRDGSLEVVKNMMQPAVRFSREECIDLPPTTYVTRQTDLTAEQKRAFDDMLKQLKAEHGGGQITAVNEAVKLSKLIQICCIREGTEVLTSEGWVEIQQVKPHMLVWDGVDWVPQSGAIFKGNRPTINCNGVDLTEDHLVMSTKGWVTAKELTNGKTATRGGLDRADVRLPDGYQESGATQKWMRRLGVCLRMRLNRRTYKSVPTIESRKHPTELRVPAREQDTRTRSIPTLQHMGPHAGEVQKRIQPGLPSLRRSRNYGLPKLAGLLRKFLGGHERGVSARLVFGPNRQRRPLYAGKLSMGHSGGAGEKQATETEGPATETRGGDRGAPVNSLLAPAQSPPNHRVYDLINCGPRNRFVVRGRTGVSLIVHNCGVAYGTEGDVLLPNGPRVELVREIIEEADAKVLVFVPLTGALKVLAAELAKDFSVEIVHGETSKNERDRIFKDFQSAKNPRVLVANPGTLSHGLTLTAANTVVWFAPINSNETYQQANARVTRPGQRLNTLIVHVEATPLERKIYDRLQGKEKTQGILLDLLKGVK